MGESCDWVSGSLCVWLNSCPQCIYCECIINGICSVAWKGSNGVVPICEVEHQRGQVGKWRCPTEDAQGQNKKQIGCHRR